MSNQTLALWSLPFCFISGSALSQSYLYADISSRTYSDPTSIHSFIHEFDGALETGDHAFTYSQAQLGVEIDNFRVGVVGRFDYFFKFTPDTARFYRDLEHKTKLEPPAEYVLSLEVNHLRATGIEIGYDWELHPTLTLTTELSYLKSNAFLDGALWGTAVRQDQDTFDVNANTLLHSDHDVFLEFPMESPRGQGYSLDLGLTWRITPDWLLAVQLNDAYSRLKWEDALESELALNTDVRRFDDDGRFHVQPHLQGRQVLVDSTQKLPKKLIGAVSYQLNSQTKLFTELFHTEYFDHYKAGVEWNIIEGQSIKFAWQIQARAFEIGYYAPYGYLQLALDSFDEHKAQALGLQTGFSIPL